MKIMVNLFILIAIPFYVYSQTTYQYDENGNRTSRIINMGKDIEPK